MLSRHLPVSAAVHTLSLVLNKKIGNVNTVLGTSGPPLTSRRVYEAAQFQVVAGAFVVMATYCLHVHTEPFFFFFFFWWRFAATVLKSPLHACVLLDQESQFRLKTRERERGEIGQYPQEWNCDCQQLIDIR